MVGGGIVLSLTFVRLLTGKNDRYVLYLTAWFIPTQSLNFPNSKIQITVAPIDILGTEGPLCHLKLRDKT